MREGTGEESDRARGGRKINYSLIIAWLHSAPEAYIICYNGYISRDNPRCGAISIYLLYTGVCPLSFVIVNISFLSLFAATLSCPIPLSPGWSRLPFDTLFLFLAHRLRARETRMTRDEKFGKTTRAHAANVTAAIDD